MAKNTPTVMVSSTYYDLRQIRQDLAQFIEKELGYNALLSELNSFPIDPDKTTIDNCRDRVQQNADVLILIIGARYGSIDKKSNKSVTNLEYLTARAKGIPVYAFIDKGILPLLSVWQGSPKTKFKGVVPDTNIFKFISQVRSEVWTNEFEHAKDITETLKIQFAHLMMEGLKTNKLLSAQKDSLPEGISGSALRLILEKPRFWEIYLLAQILADEIEKRSDSLREYQLGLVFSQGDSVTKDNIVEWALKRMDEAVRLARIVADLINRHLRTALGPVGSPADLPSLVFTAKKIGHAYGESLDWAYRVRHTHTEECLRPAVAVTLTIVDDLISKIRDFGPEVLRQAEEASLLPEGQLAKISFTFELNTTSPETVSDVFKDCLQNCEDDQT